MIGVAFNGDEERIKSDQHVYQWDTGQKIMVSGLGNSAINKVHFSFKGLKTAYVVDTTNSSGVITVDIPDIVLRYGKDVYMYLCIKNSNGAVVTIKTVIIPVIKRNMPENYMYDDDETVATSLDELQAEIQRSTGVDTDHEARIASLEGAKTNASGTTFETLKARLDDMDAKEESDKSDISDLKSDLNGVSSLVGNTSKEIYQRDYKSFDEYKYPADANLYCNAYTFNSGFIKSVTVKTLSDTSDGVLWLIGAESGIVHKKITGISGSGEIELQIGKEITEQFYVFVSINGIAHISTNKAPFYGYDASASYKKSIDSAVEGDIIPFPTFTTSGSSYYFAIRVNYFTIVDFIFENKKEIDTEIGSNELTVTQKGYDLSEFKLSANNAPWLSSYEYHQGLLKSVTAKLISSVDTGYIFAIGARSNKLIFRKIVKSLSEGLNTIEIGVVIDEPYYLGCSINGIAYKQSSREPFYKSTDKIDTILSAKVGEEIQFEWKYTTTSYGYYFGLKANYGTILELASVMHDEDNSNDFMNTYASLSMFPTFGVIGDSYASGEIFTSATSAVDSYWCSWGQILARKNGIKCTNYSHGGMTTQYFLRNITDEPYGIEAIERDEAKHMYMLVLGINDGDTGTTGGMSYLGSISDITTYESYTEYPDTFYGNYGKIIERIMVHAPSAKLIMVTTAYTDEVRVHFNNAIEEIAGHYGLPVIRQLDDPFLSSDVYWQTMYYNHPVATTYGGMANAFERLFSKCAYEYRDYFRDYLIPKNYPLD